VNDNGQFDEIHDTSSECAVWESMCPDAVDGTLSAAEKSAFDAHISGCVQCAEELSQAHRGAAWLAMLKGHAPEPPAGLMQRILAETSAAASVVAAEPVVAPAPAFVPATPDNIWTRPRVPVQQPGLWARTLDIFRVEGASAGFHPRFAMTAAMAFFSVALSLNLLGVRLQDVHSLASLRPGNITRTVADTTASAERNFQNMRVVYQLESRVSELRNDQLPGERDTNQPPADRRQPDRPSPAPQPQPSDKPHGSSELMFPPSATRTHTLTRKEV
jgi:hypothetical protein